MEKQELAQYEQKLLKEKKHLLEMIEKKSERTPDYGSDVDSFDEETDEAEEFANQESSLYAFKQRVNEIDDAINAIRSGNYGACTACNKAIEKEVLDGAPESRLCKACKVKAAK